MNDSIFDDNYGGLVSDMNISFWNTTPSLTDSTATTSTTTTTATPSAPDVDIMKQAQWVIISVLTPSISIIGLVGNILSILLISRDGLRKTSNILLIALAFSDTAFLLGNLFYFFFSTFMSPFLTYSEGVNHFVFYMYMTFRIFLLNVGLFCSYSFPMLITIERMCAVFFPLKFHVIVTSVRTLLAILGIVVLYTSYIVFFCFTFHLTDPIVFRGKTYMIIGPSPLRSKHLKALGVLDSIANQLTGTLPIVVLVLGSVAIGYKVKMAARRRAQMMSKGEPEKGKKSASQNRTTKTLLAVCVTFVVLAGIVYIIDLLKPTLKKNNKHFVFTSHVKTLIMCINSSCNFFIYVISNSKFKDSLVAMVSRKGNNSNQGKGKLPTKYLEDSSRLQ